MIIGFGADFLETWLSPVEYARKFRVMHAIANGRKGRFIQISPFQSPTAANADQWLMCRPGSEAGLAMALIRPAIEQGRGRQLPEAFRSARVQNLPVGRIFHEISYGIPGGRQPLLAATASPHERWQIVGFIKSLGVRP